jgi:superoxide reductase
MSEIKRGSILKCADSPAAIEILSEKFDCCKPVECCGKPMTVLEEKTSDAGKEKHVPVVQDGKSGVKIAVGSVPHPMEPDHYIEWVEVVNGPYVNRKYLRPGEAPEAEFFVPRKDGIKVRIYCNKHGLWRA